MSKSDSSVLSSTQVSETSPPFEVTVNDDGNVVAARLVDADDEIMLITTGGVLIRTRVSEIREMGRVTQGVTLIDLDDGERLAGLERVVEKDEDAGGPDAGDVPEDDTDGEGTEQQ